jgi:hypothetical protein
VGTSRRDNRRVVERALAALPSGVQEVRLRGDRTRLKLSGEQIDRC